MHTREFDACLERAWVWAAPSYRVTATCLFRPHGSLGPTDRSVTLILFALQMLKFCASRMLALILTF